jgi:hypothetical protein
MRDRRALSEDGDGLLSSGELGFIGDRIAQVIERGSDSIPKYSGMTSSGVS